MNNLKELKQNELLSINGGESFAYRVGQFVAIASDMHGDGILTSPGAIIAWNDWFG